MKYKKDMEEDKKRMGMMYGSMARKKKMYGGMSKKRNAMNAGGMVKAAMETQSPN